MKRKAPGKVLSQDEVTLLKPWLSFKIQTELGFPEETVLGIIIECLQDGLSPEQTKQQVAVVMPELADKFVDMTYKVLPQIKAQVEAKKKREKEEDPVEKLKRLKTDKESPKEKEKERDRPHFPSSQSINININFKPPVEVKKEPPSTFVSPSITNNNNITTNYTNVGINNSNNVSTSTSTANKFVPPPLLLDAKGREVDLKGNLLNRQRESITTLKANLRNKLKSKLDMVAKKATYFDPNLKATKNIGTRKKRTFKFIEAGSIVKKAEKMRAKNQGEKEDPVSSEKKTLMEFIKKIKDPIPEVEWWDKFLLPSNSYDTNEKLHLEEITHYVEHPVPIRPPGEKDDPIPLPMFLTKKEQKRLRKQTRQERLKEKQERILLGLEEPIKPKVKLSNLMRVLGTEATMDPTQIEQEVKKQRAERIANHEARNQEKKLTLEQKREKKFKKLELDASLGTHVLVYKIHDLSDPRHKFKIDVNARNFNLTGCGILYKDMNLVVVEGGQKSITKFKKMMQKINWNKPLEEKEGEKQSEKIKLEGKSNDHKETQNSTKNTCDLIWEVNTKKKTFAFFLKSLKNLGNYFKTQFSTI